MRELPGGVSPYKRTPTFDEESLPKGLLAVHRTKAGVWGLVVIEAGAVDYVIEGETYRLTPGCPGVVPPEVPHRLVVVGPVRLHVVFHRA